MPRDADLQGRLARARRSRRSARSATSSAPTSLTSSRTSYSSTPSSWRKTFNTDRIRIFDFWRLEDQEPHRAAIDEVVRAAAVEGGEARRDAGARERIRLQHGDRRRSGRLLAAIPEKALEITWDPGNAQFRDEVPFPGGYDEDPEGTHRPRALQRRRAKDADGKWEWMAMGRGVIDWAGQFRALKHDGYRRAVTLETHWRGAGTPEESTRQSFAGMKELLGKAGA